MADDMRADFLGVRIAWVHRLVTRVFEQALRPTGLTLPQLELLSTLTIVSRPIKPNELAEFTAVERSTTSRNLAVPQAKGWVTATDVSPTGRAMAITITITAAGSGSLPTPAPPGTRPRPASAAPSAPTRPRPSTSGSINCSPPAPRYARLHSVTADLPDQGHSAIVSAGSPRFRRRRAGTASHPVPEKKLARARAVTGRSFPGGQHTDCPSVPASHGPTSRGTVIATRTVRAHRAGADPSVRVRRAAIRWASASLRLSHQGFARASSR